MPEATKKKNWFANNYGWLIAGAAALLIAVLLLKDHIAGFFTSSTSNSTGASGSASGSSSSSGSGSQTSPHVVPNYTKGSVVSIAAGSSGVNIRNSPTANVSTNIVNKADGGSVVGTFDSYLQANSGNSNLDWIKFVPYGPVLAGTFFYVAAKYCSVAAPSSSNAANAPSLSPMFPGSDQFPV
jgi:hypothetical protein